MFDVIFLTCHLEEKKYSTVVPILDTLLMVIGPIVGYIEAPPFGGNLWLKIIAGNSTRIGAGARRRSSLQLLRNAKMIWRKSIEGDFKKIITYCLSLQRNCTYSDEAVETTLKMGSYDGHPSEYW